MVKKIIGIAAVCLSVAFCAEAQQGRIVILHTNDTHSQIEPFAPSHKTYGDMGGVVRRMAVIDSIRNAEPNVLLVDAGDAIQGTPYFNLFKGDAEFEAMNAMGYDVRTLGNHEFDAGMEKLAQLIKGSTADFISTNYDLSATPLAGLVKPWVIREIGGYKVGFLALNVNPENLIPAESCQGVVFHDPIEAANRTARLLREKGADLVVVLSHLGYTAQEKSDTTDPQVAAASTDIDIIIGGHSHTEINPEKIDATPDSTLRYRVKNSQGRDVVIAQTGMSGAYLGCITIDPKNK